MRAHRFGITRNLCNQIDLINTASAVLASSASYAQRIPIDRVSRSFPATDSFCSVVLCVLRSSRASIRPESRLAMLRRVARGVPTASCPSALSLRCSHAPSLASSFSSDAKPPKQGGSGPSSNQPRQTHDARRNPTQTQQQRGGGQQQQSKQQQPQRNQQQHTPTKNAPNPNLSRPAAAPAAASTPVGRATPTPPAAATPAPAVAPTAAVSTPVVAAVATPVAPVTPAATPAPIAAAPVAPVKPAVAAVAPPAAPTSAAGGAGGAVPPSSGSSSVSFPPPAPQPLPQSSGRGSRVFLTLALLGGLSYGAYLWFLDRLENTTDLRDYLDIHFPICMKKLREVYPGRFGPGASTRARVARVGVKVGMVETLEEDFTNNVKKVDEHIERNITAPIRETVERVVPVITGQTTTSANTTTKEQTAETPAPKAAAPVVVVATPAPIPAPTPAPVVVAVPEPSKPVAVVPAVVIAPAVVEVPEVAVSVAELRAAFAGGRGGCPFASEGRPMPADHPPARMTDADLAELRALQAEVAAAEAELQSFTITQQQQLWADVSALESQMKERGESRLATLEAEQIYTLNSLSERQTLKQLAVHERQVAPARRDFLARMHREEENKWRRKIYLALEAQNDRMSAVADHWLQHEEKTMRANHAGWAQQMQNASDALDAGVIKSLDTKLAAHRKAEQRSAEAHKLSAALLSLQELVQRDHASLSTPWRVVSEVSKNDYTLRSALEPIAPSTVAEGVWSLHALKQVFVQLAPELKVNTFLPDEPKRWTILRQALAHLFSFTTLNETGRVILPSPATAAAASNKSVDSLDFAHQSADYAHMINASTYLASNSPELALRELEALQPGRKSEQMQAFERELRKTVQVQRAVGVVKMRVMAINNAYYKNIAMQQ